MEDQLAQPVVTWNVKCCSSEDPVHPAENVLTEETYRTWQTAEPTDHAWVELEARPPTSFNKVEIVNAGTSLVEIHGVPEGSERRDGIDDDGLEGYDIVMTSQQIMTLKDLAAHSNRGREMVYEVGRKLTPLAAKQRWQRLRVVCKQPFGSAAQLAPIGLARLRFFPCPSAGEQAAANSKPEARPVPLTKPPALVKIVPEGPSTPMKDAQEQPRKAASGGGTIGRSGAASSPGRGSPGAAPAANERGRVLPGWASSSENIDGTAGAGSTAGDQGQRGGGYEENGGKLSQKMRKDRDEERVGAAGNGGDGKEKEAGKERKVKMQRKETKGEMKTEGGRSGTESRGRGANGGTGRLAVEQMQGRHGRVGEGRPGEGTGAVSRQRDLNGAARDGQRGGEGAERGRGPAREAKEEEEEEEEEGEVGTGGRGAKRKAEERRAEAKRERGKGGGRAAGRGPTEFSKLLEGVVFAISGIQNPERAELREKALAMGALYRPDWGPDCTLLVCAFPNTPKFREVKRAGGTIVAKDWITLCHRRRQLAPIEEHLMHAGRPWRSGPRADESETEEEEEDDEWTEDDEDQSDRSKRRKGGSRGVKKETEEVDTTAVAQPGKPAALDVPAGDRWKAKDAEVASWVRADVAATEAFLRAQDEKPEEGQLTSIAAQSLILCLDDAISQVQQGKGVSAVLDEWPIVPRAVREVMAWEAGQSGRGTWSPRELQAKLARLRALYLQNLPEAATHTSKTNSQDPQRRERGQGHGASLGERQRTEPGESHGGEARGNRKPESEQPGEGWSARSQDRKMDETGRGSDVQTSLVKQFSRENMGSGSAGGKGGQTRGGGAQGWLREDLEANDSDAETEVLSDDGGGELTTLRPKYGFSEEGEDGYDTEELDEEALATAKTTILKQLQGV